MGLSPPPSAASSLLDPTPAAATPSAAPTPGPITMARKPRNSRSSSPFKVPFLVAKQLAGGRWAYYWEPSATLKKAGWKSMALGNSLDAAVACARERNEEVARWKAGAGQIGSASWRERVGP